jgi:hypothetical protein
LRQTLGGKERENAPGAGNFSIKNKNNHKLITTSNIYYTFIGLMAKNYDLVIKFQFKQQLKKPSETNVKGF